MTVKLKINPKNWVDESIEIELTDDSLKIYDETYTFKLASGLVSVSNDYGEPIFGGQYDEDTNEWILTNCGVVMSHRDYRIAAAQVIANVI